MPKELRDGGGACVLQTEEPLEQAIKFLRPLQALAPENVETHTQAYDIYSRKGGWILTLCVLKPLGEVGFFGGWVDG